MPSSILGKMVSNNRRLALVLRARRVSYKNTCILSGRARSVYGRFGMSRIVFRTICGSGVLPGLHIGS